MIAVNPHTEHKFQLQFLKQQCGMRTNKWVFLSTNSTFFVFYSLLKGIFTTRKQLNEGRGFLCRSFTGSIVGI